MNRATYEAECRAVGLEPETDATIKAAAYGLSYGEFPFSSQEHRWQTVTRPRLHQLEREENAAVEAKLAARRARAQAPTQGFFGICSDCGKQVAHSSMMTSARGPVCPDCYDQASN